MLLWLSPSAAAMGSVWRRSPIYRRLVRAAAQKTARKYTNTTPPTHQWRARVPSDCARNAMATRIGAFKRNAKKTRRVAPRRAFGLPGPSVAAWLATLRSCGACRSVASHAATEGPGSSAAPSASGSQFVRRSAGGASRSPRDAFAANPVISHSETTLSPPAASPSNPPRIASLKSDLSRDSRETARMPPRL